MSCQVWSWGVYHKIHLVIFLYIFLLVDSSKWSLIDCIEKQRVHSVLWQFQWGVYYKIHLMTFIYIFLLVYCFKWALIDYIEKQRVHSDLCQFQTRGVYCKIHLVTFLYIFLLVDCFKWALIDQHSKAKSSLWHLPVSNQGGYIVRFTWWHFFISSY